MNSWLLRSIFFFDQGAAGGGSKSFAARIHLIIWIADVEPDGRCLARGRRVSRAARSRERKVRTPQSSVPDNVREGASVSRFGAALEWLDGKCHRKYTAAHK